VMTVCAQGQFLADRTRNIARTKNENVLFASNSRYNDDEYNIMSAIFINLLYWSEGPSAGAVFRVVRRAIVNTLQYNIVIIILLL